MSRNEERRESIRIDLGKIVDAALDVSEQMTDVSHSRGIAHRSLNPRSGEYIVDSKSGFIAEYRHSDGNVYSIQVHKRDD